jgi:hypothetical protein
VPTLLNPPYRACRMVVVLGRWPNTRNCASLYTYTHTYATYTGNQIIEHANWINSKSIDP